MMLSYEGWLNGLSASCIVIFCCMFGLFFIYKSKKTNAKLLFYWGLSAIFFGLGWLGDLVDFLTILLTGKNMVNPYGLHGLICFMWLAPIYLFTMYVGAELLMPDKKWYIVAIYSVIGVIFEIFLFLDPLGSITVVYPDKPGEDLIDDSINLLTPVGVIAIIFSLSGLIFLGFGFLYKSIQSTGVVRKKFLLFSIGFILITILGLLDTFTTSGIARFLVRIGIIGGISVSYLGLREEPEKKEKIRTKKEIEVESSLFRLTKRPDQITEEEVSISKEKKICLVCKGDVSGINYICTECGAFYCMKCSQAIIDLENECWACNSPIDKSKPSKPYKEIEEEIDIGISEKPQKKQKPKK